MIAAQLIERCRAANVTLRVVGNGIDYDAADTPEADALLDEVVAHKRAVLHHLAPWIEPSSARDIFDPRPDLAEDSRVWRLLLRLAWVEDGDDPAGTFAALDFIRRSGAALTCEEGRYRIVPRFSPRVRITNDDGQPLELADLTDWQDESDWQHTRGEVLATHDGLIARLLRQLTEAAA